MAAKDAQYSGGLTTEYAWVQTLSLVHLKVRVPKTCAETLTEDSVTCTITATGLQVEVGGQSLMGGTLQLPVDPMQSSWVVEAPPKAEGATEAAGELCVALKLAKAEAALWTHLLTSETPGGEPRLLEPAPAGALPVAAPPSKQELLKGAKARVKASGMEGGSNANHHLVQDKVGEADVVVRAADLPELPVLHIKGCTGCSIRVAADCQIVKLLVEGCADCTLTVDAKITTDTFELWRCERMQVALNCAVATVQLDLSTGVSLRYKKLEHLGSVVQAGVRELALGFEDAPAVGGACGWDVLVPDHPHANDTSDQFITRLVRGALLTEPIVRLKNDFPTTRREQLEYAEQVARNAQLVGEGAAADLVHQLAGKMSQAELDEVEKLRARAQTEAVAAERDAHAEISHEARVEFKKTAGNEAFKEGNYQQAALFYLEGLELPLAPATHVLHSNLAQCFLKLGKPDKALEHCDKCLALQESFAKAHFRRALALQALERYQEAYLAYVKTLDLDPKNSQAKAALPMVQMQAERQQRQQQQQ